MCIDGLIKIVSRTTAADGLPTLRMPGRKVGYQMGQITELGWDIEDTRKKWASEQIGLLNTGIAPWHIPYVQYIPFRPPPKLEMKILK